MTNAKYHRRVRALDRLEGDTRIPAVRVMERDRLRILVSGYRSGLHRAMNGMGNTRHLSKAEA